MIVHWDGNSMVFEGQDFRGRRVTITPNTDELSIEHSPTEIHIRLPKPELVSVIQQRVLADDPNDWMNVK